MFSMWYFIFYYDRIYEFYYNLFFFDCLERSHYIYSDIFYLQIFLRTEQKNSTIFPCVSGKISKKSETSKAEVLPTINQSCHQVQSFSFFFCLAK